MKKFIQTLRNIYNIEELRKRIGYTILLVLVYRLGSFILLPGISPDILKSGIAGTQEGLVGLLNMFSGGAFGNASIFALGVMPYISASIIVQLLGMFVPSFRKMQMEGESGRRKMNQITRYLTILVLAIQGPAYVVSMVPAEAVTMKVSAFWFRLISSVILMAGSMFVMWLGERITDRGIGNGISLIINCRPSALRSGCRVHAEVRLFRRQRWFHHVRGGNGYLGVGYPGCHRTGSGRA